MENEIERNLRDALANRAAELPPEASARLLAIRYRPRGALRRPAVAAGCAVLAAAAVTAIATVTLDTGTPRAFAGWSPTPTPAATSEVQSGEAGCRSRLPTSARIEQAQRSASGSVKPWPIPQIEAGGWRTALVDVRGPYTLTLFVAANGRAELSCFFGRDPKMASLGGSFSTHPPAPVAAGQIKMVSSGSNTTPPAEGSRQFSRLVGRTGPGVEGVVFTLKDGTRVTASTGHGWFLVWWPGTRYVTAVEVETPTGATRRPFGDKSPGRGHFKRKG